jgi:hypothetical protein
MSQSPICPYCQQPAILLESSEEVYHGRDYGPLWICRPCQSWVGVHKGTHTPLGRLANAELRIAKMAAHAAFDPLWKSREMKRSHAYRWLTVAMRAAEQVHIGNLDVADCYRVVEAVKNRKATAGL